MENPHTAEKHNMPLSSQAKKALTFQAEKGNLMAKMLMYSKAEKIPSVELQSIESITKLRAPNLYLRQNC